MIEKYNQLCVWPGTKCDKNEIEKFELFMLNQFGVRTQYKCNLITDSDLDGNGCSMPGTGGRNDLFFYVHDEDIPIFAIKRLPYGIRWWEDVIKYNNNSHLYPEKFVEENPPRW